MNVSRTPARSTNRSGPAHAAELLAALSRVSTDRGDLASARAQLLECFELVSRVGTHRPSVAALESAARFAAVAGFPERAVELQGACSRLAGTPAQPGREEAFLRELRRRLGPKDFHAAWAASRATPLPREYYLSVAKHWLEGIDPALLLPGHDAAPSASSRRPCSTGALVLRTQNGSATAREQLAARHIADLRRIAHGRIPRKARDLVDTDDVVQITVVRGLGRISTIDPDRRGGFFAYLRRILLNQMRDLSRRSSGRPLATEPIDRVRSRTLSPLDDLIQKETYDRYQRALSRLGTRQREAIVLRVEYGYSYQGVADAIGAASADAARMIVSRALASVARRLQRG